MILKLGIGLVATLSLSLPVAAETSFSSKSRATLFRSQTQLLDSRAATQYADSVRLRPPSVVTPSKNGSAVFTGTYRGKYLSVARAAARKHNVPEDLFLRLVQQESNWKVRAKSNKGAIGLAQLMPAIHAKTLKGARGICDKCMTSSKAGALLLPPITPVRERCKSMAAFRHFAKHASTFAKSGAVEIPERD
jgi:hypothetical protein